MIEISETEKVTLTAAAGFLVLGAAAILAYVFSGGTVIFYGIAAVAITLGVYLAYRISQEGQMTKQEIRKRKR